MYTWFELDAKWQHSDHSKFDVKWNACDIMTRVPRAIIFHRDNVEKNGFHSSADERIFVSDNINNELWLYTWFESELRRQHSLLSRFDVKSNEWYNGLCSRDNNFLLR